MLFYTDQILKGPNQLKMLTGIISLLVYLLIASLIYRKTISALLALPIMAVILSIIGGVPGDAILTDIVGKGSLKLATTYTTTMFGAVLAELLNRLGIAKSIVKLVAEFAGDNRFFLSLILILITALLFSTLGGLGAVIMVGTIILPVILSVGITNQTAGAIFLFGISLGGMFNIVGWQLYMDVLGMPKDQIINFVAHFAFVLLSLIIIFLVLELQEKKNLFYGLITICAAAFLFLVVNHSNTGLVANVSSTQLTTQAVDGILAVQNISALVFSVILGLLVIHAIVRVRQKKTDLPFIVYLTPFIALCLALFCQWPFIPAFVAGITYAVLSSWRSDSVKVLNQSIIEGISTVIPAIVLMIGIGMLITAVQHPAFAHNITPLLQNCLPRKRWQYVIVFTVLAPLSLYRGPLSIWGMGSGLVSLLQKAAVLSGSAIMGMLLSVGQIQGICDPTNTHNIWIANYLATNTQALLRKTLPYAWAAAFLGLQLACLLGYI
jgi:hypothetical protein